MTESHGDQRERQSRRHQSRRGADAGEPLVRPHARLPLLGAGQRVPVDGPAVRGPDRDRAEPGRQAAARSTSTRSRRPPPTPTSCPAPTPARATRRPTASSTGPPPPPPSGTPAPMTGFVTDYAYTLGWQTKDPSWSVLPGTTASMIMGCFTPAGAAGALRPGDRVRGLRPLVRLGADRDDAQPRVHLRGHQHGAGGRQHQDVLRPVHLRRARQPPGRPGPSTATTSAR